MSRCRANRPLPARWRVALTASALAVACALVAGQEPQAPSPVFRTGTNIVRVDASVVDRNGDPVSDLTADDFEIREDGVLQAISSFKYVVADGRPTDDRSLPIRSQLHAASEAERDDVRTFLVLWDEYHIGEFESEYRGREAFAKAALTAFGETDLVGLMDQLTPISAIEFTRDRRGLADRFRKLEGRRGVYLPRSALEEEQMRHANAPGGIETLRSLVTYDAVRAAVIHLGTLGEGRKTLILISEGFVPAAEGRDLLARSDPRTSDDPALDLVRTANNSNVAIHVVDPRGLPVGQRLNFFIETITTDTGGELSRTNDLTLPFARAVKAASAAYLLGYARDVATDGRFHQIKVQVKRRGLNVRARTGYWAPSAEDIDRAKVTAAAAELPADITQAFASLTPQGRARQVDIFAGARLLDGGRMQVTLAWTRRSTVPRDMAARVTVTATAQDVVFDGTVTPEGTTFETAATDLRLAFTVSSEGGEVLDREARTIRASPMMGSVLAISTPMVYRATTAAQSRAMQGSAPVVPIHAGREFVRTDRVFVRVPLAGIGSSTAIVTARILDRRGASLVSLPVARLPSNDTWQVELPFGTLAMGEYALALDAESGDQRVRAIVPFRLQR
jgi:VWFA-related protein